MVAQHYRWDFIGLSTDSKPTAENPKVTNGSTYYESNTSKLFVWYNNQWYEKTATGGYELPIASASTLGGVKVGEGLEISEAGVLSATGGSGGGIVTLTTDDYDYPNNNPSCIAIWRLPSGIYQIAGDAYFMDNNSSQTYGGDGSVSTFIVQRPNTQYYTAQIYEFTQGTLFIQATDVSETADGSDVGRGTFVVQ